MDGAKAYILPGVATLLLLGYFVFRPDPDAGQTAGEAKPADQTGSLRARVDAALDRVEHPVALSAEYTATISTSLEPLVTACRAQLNAEGEVELRGTVSAAVRVGGYFKTLELDSHGTEGHEGFHLCIRQAVDALELPAPVTTQAGAFGRRL